MQKSSIATIVLSMVLVLAAGFGLSALASNAQAADNTTNYMKFTQQNTGIWVTGNGKITVVPDIAVVNAGIEVKAGTVALAQQQAATVMEQIINAIKEAGIAPADIATQQYSVQPVYTWDESWRTSTITGYRVLNSVTIKIRAIENTGSVIDEIARAGGDYTRVNNLYFTVDNPEQYYAQARENAMADAKAKAEQMAALSGIQLGKPMYISEGSNYYPPVIRYDAAYKEGEYAQAPSTPVSPGETDIFMSVQIVYTIQ
jgi:uncharacterized protein